MPISSVTSVNGFVFSNFEKSIYDLVSNLPLSIFNKKSLLISDKDIFLGLVELSFMALMFWEIFVGVYVRKWLLLLWLLFIVKFVVYY